MSRPKGDAQFFAHVRLHDNVAQVDSIVELIGRIQAAADARGLEPDFDDLEVLDDEDVLGDAEELATIRDDLRRQLGAIEREPLTPTPHEEPTDDVRPE
jgi:hypothetical protein